MKLASKKAKELVNKYYCAKDSIGLSYCVNYSNAKAASLIAVDLVLETNTFWNKEILGVSIETTEEFWQEVKQEIQKL